jgi:hypothetical protein
MNLDDTPNPQRHQFPPDTCMDVDDGYVCKEKKGHAGQHVGASDTTVHCWEPRVDPVREQLMEALKLAQPILDEELQTLCGSFCPPCKDDELFDYSELSEPELGWIARTEAALDAVDAALKLAETQKEEEP